MLTGPEVFGLYKIDELCSQPEVKRANAYDSSLVFFMDSANVWYYAIKENSLYVFDSQTDEVDCIGDLASVETLLTEWEEVKNQLR